MLEKKAVQIVDPSQDQFVSHIFLAAKKSGGVRPVINLKKINQSGTNTSKGIPSLVDILISQDFMVKLDLKDAYFSVPVSKCNCKYLCFRWENTMYQFKFAPFRLAPVPRLFTKLLKPVMALLRRSGIRCVIFLDDLIMLNQDKQTLTTQLESVMWLLQNLGFEINWKKSVISPCKQIEYLGFIVGSVAMKLYLPEKKVADIRQQCLDLLRTGKTSQSNWETDGHNKGHSVSPPCNTGICSVSNLRPFIRAARVTRL